MNSITTTVLGSIAVMAVIAVIIGFLIVGTYRLFNIDPDSGKAGVVAALVFIASMFGAYNIFF